MFLKWMGSKDRYLPELLTRMPKEFGHYYEPFLGSGALFFELAKRGDLVGGATLSDTNLDLVCAYLGIKDPDRLPLTMMLLDTHRKKHSKKYYNRVRDLETSTISERGARFLYLNRTAFSGIWRENLNGKFNVPCKEESIAWLPPVPYYRASALLKDAVISGKDYSTIDPSAGDFVYFDPPYTEFYLENRSYTAKSFTLEHQKELKNFIDVLTDRGVKVMLTNSPDDFTTNLYRDYNLDYYPVSYRTNGLAEDPDKLDLIVTNY